MNMAGVVMGLCEFAEEEAEERDRRDEARSSIAPKEGKLELYPQGIPAGPACRGGSLLSRDIPDKVDESSEESFPASDPPSWTPAHIA
jgi:hypothetical protein